MMLKQLKAQRHLLIVGATALAAWAVSYIFVIAFDVGSNDFKALLSVLTGAVLLGFCVAVCIVFTRTEVVNAPESTWAVHIYSACRRLFHWSTHNKATQAVKQCISRSHMGGK